MSELLKLAERCERQDGAVSADVAWLLDEAFCECFPKPERIWITDNTGDCTPEYTAFHALQWRFQEFLQADAFLDAAMTLVPEGWRWIMREACPDKANPNERGFFARLETRDFESVTWGKGSDWLTDVVAGQDVFCWAATPALALCAAALRARASMSHGEKQ